MALRFAFAVALLAVSGTFCISGLAFAQNSRGRCIVIDSDADIDDMRAIATLAPKGNIAAIVVTEGIARTRSRSCW